MRLLSAVIQVILYKRFAAAWVIPAVILMNLSAYAACMPAVKIVSSQPADRSKDADPAAPIIITWDKTVYTLPAGTQDYKPMLGSINMAGGRYGLGTLLTTEWGVGGQVAWDGDKETITPEAPLEPGTQYRAWTYVYTSGGEVCPVNGGEIVFVTAGNPPEDNKPVRKFDLTSLYHGNETGSGKIEGEIIAIDNNLHVITVKEGMLKKVNVVLYEGIMVMRGGNPGSPSDLKVGDAIKGEFMGGRLYMITVSGGQ